MPGGRLRQHCSVQLEPFSVWRVDGVDGGTVGLALRRKPKKGLSICALYQSCFGRLRILNRMSL